MTQVDPQHPEPGDQFTLEYRVVGHANSAALYYWTKELPVFVPPEEAFGDDVPRLMVEQSYIEEADESDAEHCRAFIDGIPADPDHELISSLTPRGEEDE